MSDDPNDGRYYHDPKDAPEEDTELIDVVRRVYDEQRPYYFPWFDVGRTDDELMAFFKEYDKETDEVLVSCNPNRKTGCLTVLPLFFLERGRDTYRTE